MSIDIHVISNREVAKILGLQEGHFMDAKSCQIKPADLTRTMSAFANADGGEIYIGLQEDPKGLLWNGFGVPEDANGHIQAFEELFPLGDYFGYEFLKNNSQLGVILRCEISKTPDIRRASNGKVYLRRGAQNLPQNSDLQIRRIEFNKGLFSFEDEKIDSSTDNITLSRSFAMLKDEIVPNFEPVAWLRKQRLINKNLVTVAGCILFDDEPQAALPKAAIKIYRYKTDQSEGSRDLLDFNPIRIEGSAYELIQNAVRKTIEIAERFRHWARWVSRKLAIPGKQSMKSL